MTVTLHQNWSDTNSCYGNSAIKRINFGLF